MHELHDTTVTSDVTSALNYKQGIERQLSSVDFFTDDSQTSILKNATFTKTYHELDFGTQIMHYIRQLRPMEVQFPLIILITYTNLLNQISANYCDF